MFSDAESWLAPRFGLVPLLLVPGGETCGLFKLLVSASEDGAPEFGSSCTSPAGS